MELMGVDFSDVGYLSYCAEAGYGQGDLSRINVIGPSIAQHRIAYRMHDRFEQLMKWKEGYIIDPR